MIRRITRTRRVVFPRVPNNAIEVLRRRNTMLCAEEKERLAYMAGLSTDMFEAQAKLEDWEGTGVYLDEAKGTSIEEDWLNDELADLQSIAKQMRPFKVNPLRDDLLAIVAKIEEKRDEAVKDAEYRNEQLDLLGKALDSLT